MYLHNYKKYQQKKWGEDSLYWISLRGKKESGTKAQGIAKPGSSLELAPSVQLEVGVFVI